MKKIILLGTIAFLNLISTAQQQLPNASFEDWTLNPSLGIENPDSWEGGRARCTGGFSICKSTTVKTTDAHSGLYAIELNNYEHLSATIKYSKSSELYQPYTSSPTQLTGYYKFNKAGVDSVTIQVKLTGASDSVLIKSGTLVLTESKTGYTLFAVPLEDGSSTSSVQHIEVSIQFNEYASSDSKFTLDDLNFTNEPLGLEEPVFSKFECYPNPSVEYLNFKESVENLTIKDLNGIEVFKCAAVTDAIAIGGLAKGIYLISYEQNKELFQGKLLIQP